MIYHITSRTDWQAALAAGQYRAGSLATEGFIHCSTLLQVLPVAENFYKGQSGLVLLSIDPPLLCSSLKWELPSGGAPPLGVPQDDLFPHIYGPINLNAVVNVFDFEEDPDGKFKLPVS